MSSGSYIFMGLTMLLLIPVFMSYVGGTFGETITGTEEQNFTNPTQGEITADEGAGFFEGLWIGLKDFLTPNWLTNAFIGYSILPWWINIFLTVIPLALLIRGIIATN